MRIRTLCAGIMLVVGALLIPSRIQAGLRATECIGGSFSNGFALCGDPGTPPAKGVGLLREAAGSPVPVVRHVSDFKLADVDSDGALDVVLLSIGTFPAPASIQVMRGDGHGGFGAPIVSDAAGFVRYLAVGDVNRDGRPDVAVVSSPNPFVNTVFLEVLLGNGNGTFTSSATVTSGEIIDAKGVAIAEVTGDDDVDVVTMSNGVSFVTDAGVADVFPGDGTGAFASPARTLGTTFFTPPPGAIIRTNAFAVADVNGDGKSDVLTNSEGVAVWYGNGSGTFASPVTEGAPSAFLRGIGSSVATADLNGDGLTDVVQFDGLQFRVLINSPAGFGTVTSIYQAAPNSALTHSTSMALADIDGDGFLDAVGMVAGASTLAPHVSVLFGDGAGGFSNPSFYPARNSRLLAVGDLNGDGRPDVVGATDVFTDASRASELTVLLHVSGAGIDALSAAVNALGLPAGTAHSLHVKLKAAAASHERGNKKATINQLNAFISQIDALRRSGQLTAAQALSVTTLAQQVIAGL